MSDVQQKLRKVPELSLMSYLEGSSLDQVKFVDKLFTGLKDYGFIVLVDHPVTQLSVDQSYQEIQRFFSLSEEKKRNYHIKGLGGQRGYTPFKTEHAKDNNRPDLKEFWHVGRTDFETETGRLEHPANVWPTEVPDFEKTLTALYRNMDKTSLVLLEAIGRGLDVPPNFFKTMVRDGNSVLRLIHYPPVHGEDTKNMVRAAAHGDINLITLLVGATDSGLELLDHDDTWLPVQSSPGQIVVDTGDMMARLTNDVLPSTIHRVVNPDNEATARYSMPFFVHPHSEASLKCLPSCLGTGEKYPEITAGAFLYQRLKEIGLY
jgi:isopenicillin N synthase-like dioxygenase